MISNNKRILAWGIVGALLASQLPSLAHAELALSHLVVQLQPGQKAREDIEVANNSAERAYVVVEPSEIVNAGMAGERRHQEQDPERRGLLVTPARMILEPGQRKLVRVSTLLPAAAEERVYRVTVKPVAGELQSTSGGLKILVGYDVLVLVRPSKPQTDVRSERVGNDLKLRNLGNASVELVNGRQCSQPKSCKELPGKRLYPGAEWVQNLNSSGLVEYTVISSDESVRSTF